MSAEKVNVMTALSRTAYGDEAGCLDYLHTLDHDDLIRTALGLARMAAAFMERVSHVGQVDLDKLHDSWLGDLTDTANAGPP